MPDARARQELALIEAQVLPALQHFGGRIDDSVVSCSIATLPQGVCSDAIIDASALIGFRSDPPNIPLCRSCEGPVSVTST